MMQGSRNKLPVIPTLRICKLLLIMLAFVALQSRSAFPQGESKPQVSNKHPEANEIALSESIKQAVEKAIKETEEEKERKLAQLSAELEYKLNLAIQEWISGAKRDKEPELDKFLHQDWRGVSEITYPIPYDYYLRRCDYLVTKADCSKTDSLIAPYKAYIKATEKLYIESYHPSNVSDVKQYLYTVSRPITVSLEYRGDKFSVTGTEYGSTYFERGWPKE